MMINAYVYYSTIWIQIKHDKCYQMFIEIILLGRAFIFLATKKREYKFRTNFGNKYLDIMSFSIFFLKKDNNTFTFFLNICVKYSNEADTYNYINNI